MRFKEFAFSLSLSNLVFSRVYSDFSAIGNSLSNQYYVEFPPASADYLAFVLNVLALLAVLWILAIYARRKPASPMAAVIWPAVCIITMLVASLGLLRIAGLANTTFAVRVNVWTASFFDGRVFIALALLLVMACIFVTIRWRYHFRKIVVAVIVALSPFALITLGQAILYSINGQATEEFLNKRPIQVSDALHAPATRVVVLLFDELDYRMAFADRPMGLHLPEIDRLRSQAVFTTNAFPPGSDTVISIPAIMTGKMLAKVAPVRANELMITPLGGSEARPWSTTPNTFSEAQQFGFTSALVGWAHPYCRVFGDKLQQCYYRSVATQFDSMGTNFASRLCNQWRSLFETPRLSPFGQSLVVKESVVRFKDLLANAIEVIDNGSYDLVFIHLPIPHTPYAYNSKTKEFALANSLFAGYIDNLVLVDRTLGHLRQRMEMSGSWDSSTVIVTSDHWWRNSREFDGKEDWRVPLLIKMPGQILGTSYAPKLNTVILHDLILALLRRNVVNSEDVVGWLNRNGKPFKPVPIQR